MKSLIHISHISRVFAKTLRTGFAILLSGSAAAQSMVAPDPPVFVERTPAGASIMWLAPYRIHPAEVNAPPYVAPSTPYSCYRIGRCSAYDLYRFRDRPNRLTRLAPAVPRESVGASSSIPFLTFWVPDTPDENIAPAYKAASKIRDEYRDAGRPIDAAR